MEPPPLKVPPIQSLKLHDIRASGVDGAGSEVVNVRAPLFPAIMQFVMASVFR